MDNSIIYVLGNGSEFDEGEMMDLVDEVREAPRKKMLAKELVASAFDVSKTEACRLIEQRGIGLYKR